MTPNMSSILCHGVVWFVDVVVYFGNGLDMWLHILLLGWTW